MLDIKINTTMVVVDIVLGLSGILFWYSDSFAHFFGVKGFLSRLFAGLVCFIVLGIITYIATRN